MSVAAIRKAMETALLAMPGALPKAQTEFENVKFTPQAGVPYWRVNFMFPPPENPSFGDGFYRQRGYMAVAICWPFGVGTKDATALAQELRSYFKRALPLVANSVTTEIDRTPEIASGRVDGDRWVIPVRVRFFANVGG